MSFQRVIQDSDDEEDVCSDIATSIDPLQDQSSQEDAPDDKGHDVNTNCGLDGQGPYQMFDPNSELPQVDFDRFLQSESSVIWDQGLSPSQQRREERWIPTEDGSACVATLVSHNFLGQGQPREVPYSTDTRYTPLASDSMGTELSPAKKLNGHEMIVESGVMRRDETKEDLQTPRKRRRILTAMEDASTKVRDGSEAAGSYNYFDSFSAREHTEVRTLPLTSSTGHAVDGDKNVLHLTPGRSKSLQAVFDSPPPTEPFSSLVSLQQKRSKSVSPERNLSLESLAAIQDDHHSSMETEIPTAKKKRGRPKKQAVNETGEDVKELTEGVNSHKQLNKRRPGRPRKTDKAHDVNQGDEEDDSEIEVTAVITKAAGFPQNALNEHNVFDHDGQNSEQLGSNEPSEIPPRSSPDELDPGLPAEMYRPRPSRSRGKMSDEHSVLDTTEASGKVVKKKKIKRGKTASMVLNKPHKSDVEDDVLWIEDRPISTMIRDESLESSKTVEADRTAPEKDGGEDTTATKEGQNTKPGGPTDLPSTGSSGPEVKKRGRKRKKTNQEFAVTELSNGQEPTQESNEDRVKHTTKNVLQDISNLTSPIKSEDKKPRRKPAIDNPEVALFIERQEDDYTNTNTIQSSPHKSSVATSPDPLLETPKKKNTKELLDDHGPSEKKTPSNASALPESTATPTASKGPDKHSPIARASKVPFRVGLSRRARIAPLLKMVRK